MTPLSLISSRFFPKGLGVALLAVWIAGCVTIPEKAITKEDYDALKTAPVKNQESLPGSLWKGENNQNMLFSDNKARYINDVITIIVSETSTGTNTASVNASRKSSNDTKISALFGLNTSILNSNPTMGTTIGAGGSSANETKGAGDTSRTGTLTAKVAGRVVRVLAGGNLLIEGRKQVTVNHEVQFVVITGVVRPQDVTVDNLVYSQNISDAKIVLTGSGVANDKTTVGWGTRVLDWAWPF